MYHDNNDTKLAQLIIISDLFLQLQNEEVALSEVIDHIDNFTCEELSIIEFTSIIDKTGTEN